MAALAFLAVASAQCARTGPATASHADTTLRVGVAQIEIKSLIQNLAVESLEKVQENGTLKPWLAKNVTTSPDGLTVTVELRPGVRFHDGSPASAEPVASALRSKLPGLMGSTYDDVEKIQATSDTQVVLILKRPSRFVQESLEVPISKPGSDAVGTGPFVAGAGDRTLEMEADANYYLGRPNIDHIRVQSYPTVRAAWAELLRGNIDMMYEVGTDALESLDSSTSVHVYPFVRRYQYEILLNAKAPELKSAAVRRALNAAIDRPALIHDALSGHGLPSSGPVWPKHWAFNSEIEGFTFDPGAASQELKAAFRNNDHKLTFTCLVTGDMTKIGLVIKQQLERVGIEMNVKEASLAELNEAASTHRFDAILATVISGPTILRPYMWWYTNGPFNRAGYSNRDVDKALDAVRFARSDDEYRQGVVDFQRAALADPPAIFLAWDELARAVSTRFEVPADPGVDILGALRLWRPVAGPAHADKN